MVHPENERRSSMFIRQINEIFEQSFFMAERLIESAIERRDVTGTARDEYFQAVPMIADRISQQIGTISQMTRAASEKDLDEFYESMQECIEVMKSRNKSAK